MKMAWSSWLLVLGLILCYVSFSEQNPTKKPLRTENANGPNYIELGLVLDSTIHEKLDKDADRVKQYCLDLEREANAILRQANVSVLLVEVIIWKDQFPITSTKPATLESLQAWSKKEFALKAPLNTVILVSGFRDFIVHPGAFYASICEQPPSAAVSWINAIQPKQNAMVVVHLIGHLLGAHHDQKCRSCVMSPSDEEWSGEGLSEGSVQELKIQQENGLWKCLENTPSKLYGEVENMSD